MATVKNRYIYKITDKSTGEFYIGCRTCVCPISEDDYMGSSKYWMKNKPDPNNLTKEILETGFKSDKDKFARESEIIGENFDDPNNVNIHNPAKNFWGDTYYSGEENGMYGIRGEKHHGATPVYQFSKSGEFIREWRYVKEPQKELGLNYTAISSCASGRSFTAHGYVWRYKDEVKSIKTEGEKIKKFFKEYEHPLTGRGYSEEVLNKMRETKIGMYDGEKNPFYNKSHSEESRKKMSAANAGSKHPFHGKTRPNHSKRMKGRKLKKKEVIHIPSGAIYESLGEASRETGLSAGTICGHCKGKYVTQKFKYHG